MACALSTFVPHIWPRRWHKLVASKQELHVLWVGYEVEISVSNFMLLGSPTSRVPALELQCNIRDVPR